MKIFIIECPNPIDLLQDRTECQSLEKVCKIIGHEVVSFLVKSKSELETVIKYISTIDASHDMGNCQGSHVCIHISSHGNDEGLAFGADFVNWKELLQAMEPLYLMEDYPRKLILSISACGANHQKITINFKNHWNKFKEKDYTPPCYLFVFDEESVRWSDAVLGWTILYHQLAKADLENKKSIQDILFRIRNSYLGNLKYYRWDEQDEEYKRFLPKEKEAI